MMESDYESAPAQLCPIIVIESTCIIHQQFFFPSNWIFFILKIYLPNCRDLQSFEIRFESDAPIRFESDAPIRIRKWRADSKISNQPDSKISNRPHILYHKLCSLTVQQKHQPLRRLWLNSHHQRRRQGGHAPVLDLAPLCPPSSVSQTVGHHET